MNTFLFLKIMITHKFWVTWYLLKVASKLIWRGLVHDNSKFRLDECLGFLQVIDKLEGSVYGSKEYRESLKQIGPSVSKHKQRNSHHPEYYGALKFMSIYDLIEMICDWKAAMKRGQNGNIDRSFKVAKEKFKMTKELEELLRSL